MESPQWDDLASVEQLAHLRQHTNSPHHPTFADDPTIWANCDTCGPTVTNHTGNCACGKPTNEAEELQ